MEIRLEKVSYKDKIKNISYEFEEGKITSVIGTSGSGKSLVSYLISNTLDKFSGVVDNPYQGREISYVFQNPEEAFIFSSVREELSFGLTKYNYRLEELDKRIEDALRMVGLPKVYLDKNPFKLSSGEKQLVALAIALITNPKVLILDAPTTYLDNKKESELVKLLKKLKNRYHKTIIIFSSDIEFILKVTDNYLLLKKGKVSGSGVVKDLLTDYDKLKSSGIEVPKIIEFINTVKKKKNISLDFTFDIKELMKDVYRNVR